jgi:molybdopterin converting factor subunit 1
MNKTSPRTITLLYFAAVRDLVVRDEERVALPEEVVTVADLARFLETYLPALAGRLGAVRFARNETFAESSERIEEGDVVALIPPVAGG